MSTQNSIWHSEGSQQVGSGTIWTVDGGFSFAQSGSTPEKITEHVYYDLSRDALVVREVLQSQGTTAILPNGILWLKGTVQLNSGLTKEFRFTPSGNLEVRALIEE